MTPWKFVAGFSGMAVGCQPPPLVCHDYQTYVNITSADFLVVNDGPSDTAEERPTLRAELRSPWALTDVSIVESALSYENGRGYTLEDTIQLKVGGESPRTVKPDDLSTTFSLLFPPGNLGFQPSTQQGRVSELELWNGWTLDLSWHGPLYSCK